MSDPDQPQPEVPEVVKVARDLREIETMFGDLEDQAEAKANATIDGTGLPGGLAMVEIAGAAKPDELAELIAFAELHHFADCKKADHKTCRVAGAEHVEDQDADWEPVLQTLLFWSEQLRAERNEDYGRQPTVASEANYLRYMLDAMWKTEPHWDDFATDIRQARTRLENVLLAGRRAERSWVTCDRCEEESRLVKVWGQTFVAGWSCRCCAAVTPERYRCDECGRRCAPRTGRCESIVGKKDDRHVCLGRLSLTVDRDRCPTCWSPVSPKPALSSDAADDFHKCPSCKTRFSALEFRSAHAKQLRSEGAMRFVRLADAIGTLTNLGRPERTIRGWLRPPVLEHTEDKCDECGKTWAPAEYPACPAERADGDECGGELAPVMEFSHEVIEGYCDVTTHASWIWWPDIWRLHLVTKTRKRDVAC